MIKGVVTVFGAILLIALIAGAVLGVLWAIGAGKRLWFYAQSKRKGNGG